MLGGLGELHTPDVAGSLRFIDALRSGGGGGGGAAVPLPDGVALDCGAGIGRVTGSFLIDHFDECDLVEPVAHFIGKAEETLGGESKRPDGHRCVNFFAEPLESFTPEPA